MYKNLIQAMKTNKITFTQIAELLHCQLNTVSDKTDGTCLLYTSHQYGIGADLSAAFQEDDVV